MTEDSCKEAMDEVEVLSKEEREKLIEVVKGIGDRVFSIDDAGSHGKSFVVELNLKPFTNKEWRAITELIEDNNAIDYRLNGSNRDLPIGERKFLHSSPRYTTLEKQYWGCMIMMDKLDADADDSLKDVVGLLQILIYAFVRCQLFGTARINNLMDMDAKEANHTLNLIMGCFMGAVRTDSVMSPQMVFSDDEVHEKFLFKVLIAINTQLPKAIERMPKKHEIKLRSLLAHTLIMFVIMFDEYSIETPDTVTENNDMYIQVGAMLVGLRDMDDPDPDLGSEYCCERCSEESIRSSSAKKVIESGEKCKGFSPEFDKLIDAIIGSIKEKEGIK
jgi:hypothetical protein